MSDIMSSEYLCDGKVNTSDKCPNNPYVPYHLPIAKQAKKQIKNYLESNNKTDLAGTCFYHIVASSESGVMCPTLKDSLTWAPSGWTVAEAVENPNEFLKAVLDFAD